MRRVFDICHGCRRCFNLCDSFPRLFDLIDDSPTEDVEALKSEDFKPVVEACTLCDMCFMTKCPYVPPHPFNAGFSASDAAPPRRRGESRARRISPQRQLAEMDRNGTLARVASPRRQLGVGQGQQADAAADGKGRRHRPQRASCRNSTPALSCRADKSEPDHAQRGGARFRQAQGRALCHLLRQLQQAATPAWRRAPCSIISASRPRSPIPAAAACRSWNRPNWTAWRRTPPRSPRNSCKLIDEGYDIVALTASCGLMLKFEWALIVPDNRRREARRRRRLRHRRICRRHRQEGGPARRA